MIVYFRRTATPYWNRRTTDMPRHTNKERPHRDLLQIPDFTAKELERLFSLAEAMRNGKYKKQPLAGKSLAMIFMKSSPRPRVSFEVGA